MDPMGKFTVRKTTFRGATGWEVLGPPEELRDFVNKYGRIDAGFYPDKADAKRKADRLNAKLAAYRRAKAAEAKKKK